MEKRLEMAVSLPGTRIIGGLLLLVFSSRLAFPLPFSPVPVTAQTFAVLFLGIFLGKELAAETVLLYLFMGSAGFPFFAAAGPFFMGPTAGYLLAFPFSAYLAGYFHEKGKLRSFPSRIFLLSISSLPIYVGGLSWLSLFVGWKSALELGFLPFIPGDLVKILVLSAIMGL